VAESPREISSKVRLQIVSVMRRVS
jgi:hypothetical protein